MKSNNLFSLSFFNTLQMAIYVFFFYLVRDVHVLIYFIIDSKVCKINSLLGNKEAT
jgi:hypothetical protein